MSAPRKRWSEHSRRWQREAIYQGLKPSRWDAWFDLSPAARRVTDIRRYAQGESVASQRRQTTENAVVDKMLMLFANAREQTVRLGAEEMSARQLRWTLKAQTFQIRKRAAQKPTAGQVRNPWWYR